VYSKDPEQHKRGIFFCVDILRSYHFLDPAEMTNKTGHEYAVYTLFDDYKVQRTAANYWEFVTDCCLGSKHTQLIKDPAPEQVFMPVSV
jgi:hypothetical protein